MKGIILFFALVMGAMVLVHHSFQDGSVLRYIDDHRTEPRIPAATYYIGQSYYLVQDLQDATTYFWRVKERYPDHPYAANALFYYLQCLDDQHIGTRDDRLQGYLSYLEKYPNGKHATIVQARADSIRTGPR